jgi:nucleotide-binding universal stress UspA family protein
MTKKQKQHPILVPIDFSAYSEASLLCAAELAHALNSPIHVLHVVHDPGEAPGYYSVKGHHKQLERLEDTAADMLEKYLADIRDKYRDSSVLQNAESSLVVGLPVNRILETAKKINARMIVMGSQGRTGLSHIMLGSKAEQVVRLSPIPVTIVKDAIKKKT